jgi:histidinol-phosphate phosphatase family protein
MGSEHFLADVDESWTLFLDRDGVINRKIDNDYVKSIGEFEFLPGVLESLYSLQDYFYKIIIVTNQQGIAKGTMTEEGLDKVHQYLLYEVEKAHARIDQIYHCPHFASECTFCRKPNNGMALMAQADDPIIDFEKSIIVGDSISDMEFGKKSGMHTVMIGSQKSQNCDIFVPSLISFSNLLLKYQSK